MLSILTRALMSTGGKKYPFVESFASAYVNANGRAITCDKPAGTVAGEVLVGVMAVGGGTDSSWNNTSGWTEAFDQNATPSLRLAYKIAGGSEPANYTFNTQRSVVRLSAVIFRISKAAWDTNGALDVVSGANNHPVAPSINSAGGLLFGAFAAQQGGAGFEFSVPDQMRLLWEDKGRAPTFSVFAQYVGSGATGSRTSENPDTGRKAGILFSVKKG